ncbi:TonB family protein [Methylobacterium sp. 4-46]|uniref:TonB family protein n=1 Tax=unclassified Methylobacterium TaxID=2615210 RepID=UPI000165C932|nr:MULTISPECIES: TonB family protein [Methylobacterium]ACA15070.1 TonB family protein [Methylobacterium sp. 4-46]WFT80806.1 TonB family protein [Methylobacterium nodulans]
MTAAGLAEARDLAPPRSKGDHPRALARAAAFAVALAAHGLLLWVPRPSPAPPSAVETLEISVVAQGDATTDEAEETRSAAEMPPEPEPAPPEPPLPPPPAEAEPPPVRESPAAPAIPVRPPEPPAPPRPAPPKPPKPRPPERPRAETRPPRKPDSKPSQASMAQHRAHAGADQGANIRSGQAVAAYGAILKAEINRHKSYPAAARDRQASGVVMVSFAIGPSGRIASAAIGRSSGDPALDAAALQAVRAASPPPPPGGHFSGRIAIEYALRR